MATQRPPMSLSPVQTARLTPLSSATTRSKTSASASSKSASVQFLKSPGSSHNSNALVALATPVRRQRPATAMAPSSLSSVSSSATMASSSSSAMIHALMASHPSESRDEPDALSPNQSHIQQRRRQQQFRSSPDHDDDPAIQVLTRHTQRCAGCGAYAEMCMACLSQLRRQDGASYKRRIIRSVEVLFERATARAFTKMSHVVLQWIFGTWKRETRQQRRRHALAIHVMEMRRVQRLWRAWHKFIYQRRTLGAMLYAEEQQQATRAKNHEIVQLHGDVFELNAGKRLEHTLQQEMIEQLQRQLDAQQRSLNSKTQELLAVRKELHDARERIVLLETQAIDPKELERIRTENADAKKMVFQLAAAVLQGMETDFDVLSSSEGRQNLNGVLSKDVVQMLDKPEHAGFFNPLVELHAIPANASEAEKAQLLMSFEAPVDRADRILIQWVNALLQKQTAEWVSASKVVNFNASFSDGRAFTVLTKVLHAAMCKFRPKRPPGFGGGMSTGGAPTNTGLAKLEASSVMRENGEDLTEIAMERYVDHVKREESPEKQLELMIGTIGQALWMPKGLLRAQDILAGDSEINFATLTYLFCTSSPSLEDAHYALCNDLKGQLSSVKAKWRELRESMLGGLTVSATAPAAGGTMLAMANERTSGGQGTSSQPITMSDELAMALSAKLKLALAQTLELKKKLDSEDVKAREGHLLWWKSARIVLRKCFLSYARLARGKAGVLSKMEASQDENDAFSKLPTKSRLLDLELAFEDFAWECKLMQSYLGTVFCDLARIYRGYATRGGDTSNQFITVGDFLELLTECRLVDGALITTQDIVSIVRKLDPKLAAGPVSNSRSLSPSEFLEGLVRTARRKYAGEHHRVSISEAFCLLVDNFILPFAFRADADVFRKQIEDPKIRRLLIKFADELRELYASYAVEDTRRKTRKRPRVTAYTFSQCLLDRNVQDVSFNSEKVQSVVQRVARTAKKEAAAETAAANTAASGAGALMLQLAEEDELTFEEFEEAMIVTACYKFPDPYTSLESRLEKFLTFYVRGNGASMAKT